MILIKLKDESHQLISDVYYIPTMKSNILSLGQLLEKGYEIKMKNRSLTLLDTKRVEISINKRKTLKFYVSILIFEGRREKSRRRWKKRSPVSSRHFNTIPPERSCHRDSNDITGGNWELFCCRGHTCITQML